MPVSYGVVVGMVIVVTLIIVCSGNYRKFVDLKGQLSVSHNEFSGKNF